MSNGQQIFDKEVYGTSGNTGGGGSYDRNDKGITFTGPYVPARKPARKGRKTPRSSGRKAR